MRLFPRRPTIRCVHASLVEITARGRPHTDSVPSMHRGPLPRMRRSQNYFFRCQRHALMPPASPRISLKTRGSCLKGAVYPACVSSWAAVDPKSPSEIRKVNLSRRLIARVCACQYFERSATNKGRLNENARCQTRSGAPSTGCRRAALCCADERGRDS